MNPPSCRTLLPVHDYDLAATLESGQAFRWVERNGTWEGVIESKWVQLRQHPEGIAALTTATVNSWQWLEHYLQTHIDLSSILQTFPDDKPMCASVAACRGLRLLRQDPWECLASFIISSTKQIVQIRQIVALLCPRFGTALAVPAGNETVFSFPTPDQLSAATEEELRACKMGFRAPNLLAAARTITAGGLDLDRLQFLPVGEARQALMQLRGVGEKIANCVLLFAYGRQEAFPVDVWVMKALRQLYFPRRRPRPERLRQFVQTHFGPNAGYAQQYLFHFMRTSQRKASRAMEQRSTKVAASP
jgi:N-glycosylase/DNA lyase